MKTALLLSGGMDSISIAYWKRPQYAITINYGQRAAQAEHRAAEQICKELNIKHEVVETDCSAVGSGDMCNGLPNNFAQTSDWWPYRNQLIITLACMRLISLGVQILYVGTVKSDGENHRDGTVDFVRMIDKLTAYQEGGINIIAPAIEYSTAELVMEAKVPPSLLAWAHSCHKADIACGDCRGCNKYLATFAELGSEYFTNA